VNLEIWEFLLKGKEGVKSPWQCEFGNVPVANRVSSPLVYNGSKSPPTHSASKPLPLVHNGFKTSLPPCTPDPATHTGFSDLLQRAVLYGGCQLWLHPHINLLWAWLQRHYYFCVKHMSRHNLALHHSQVGVASPPPLGEEPPSPLLTFHFHPNQLLLTRWYWQRLWRWGTYVAGGVNMDPFSFISPTTNIIIIEN
jgi:hypothetical protein